VPKTVWTSCCPAAPRARCPRRSARPETASRPADRSGPKIRCRGWPKAGGPRCPAHRQAARLIRRSSGASTIGSDLFASRKSLAVGACFPYVDRVWPGFGRQ
jgi:hypothetical protein